MIIGNEITKAEAEWIKNGGSASEAKRSRQMIANLHKSLGFRDAAEVRRIADRFGRRADK